MPTTKQQFETLKQLWEKYVDTPQKRFAVYIATSIALLAAVLWTLFFLFSSPLEEGSFNQGNTELRFGEVSIPTLEHVVGERGAHGISFDTGLRSTEATIGYHYFLELWPEDMDAYIRYLTTEQGFWLISQGEVSDGSEDSEMRAVLLKVYEGSGIVQITINRERGKFYFVDYTMRDFGLFNMPFDRAAATDAFAAEYGIGAAEILYQYGGLGFDAMEAYLRTVGATLEDMPDDQVTQFNSDLRSFIWSMILMSGTILSPFIIVGIIRTAFNAKVSYDNLAENNPTIYKYGSEVLEKIKTKDGEQPAAPANQKPVANPNKEPTAASQKSSPLDKIT